jgi:hypothetical protein
MMRSRRRQEAMRLPAAVHGPNATRRNHRKRQTLVLRGGGRLRAGVAVTHAWFQLGKGIFTGAFLSSQPFTTRGNQYNRNGILSFGEG